MIPIADLFDGNTTVATSSFNLDFGGEKITTDATGTTLFVANSSVPNVYTYSLVPLTGVINTPWTIAFGTGPGQVMTISDIEYYQADNSILIADSNTTCISVYSISLERKIMIQIYTS